ncbi:hypothetical protein RJ641_026353 [Dillenia turbinata]|uniref:Uncharacterized protein n=1 Tax=Dillenia turbinata TaxID=194707 RepID=A0AAN8WC68_9MAGN
MEHDAPEMSHDLGCFTLCSTKLYDADEGENGVSNEVAEHNAAGTSLMGITNENPSSPEKIVKTRTYDPIAGESVAHGAAIEDIDNSGDVNMEAYIMPDDVIRAGGFGAKDDIGSFLPAAIDSTDFEASLRDARDYEEPQGEISRPGLGWTEERESE